MERSGGGVQEQHKKGNRKKGAWSVLLFWIPALLLTALAVLSSLAFSQENVPTVPAGQEQAVTHLVSSLFTEGEISLSDTETAALLFPVLQNAFQEKSGLTGFSLEAKEEGRLSLAMAFPVSGSRLGLFCEAELLLQKDGCYGLKLRKTSLGKLPIPPKWILKIAGETLSAVGKTEGDTLWLPAEVPVCFWEGAEPLTITLEDLAADNGKIRMKLSAGSLPLEMLQRLLG